MSTAPIVRDQRPRVIYMSQSRKFISCISLTIYSKRLILKFSDWSRLTFTATCWLVEMRLALNTFPNAPWPTWAPISKSFIQFCVGCFIRWMFLYFETMIGNMVFRLIKFWKTIVCFETQRTKLETLTGWFLWKLFRKRKQE